MIREDLARLRDVESAIARARLAMTELDESQALRELSFAEQTLTQTLALPGAVRFYAEVQLQLGLCAAQLGLAELAEAAFARAASVEPGRRLLSGEAAPAVVALATRAYERESRAPAGELRIRTNVAGARVYLDDVYLGTAPVLARARAGVHALRLEADGYRPYGGLLDVAQGLRPEQYFVLSLPAVSEALAKARVARDAVSMEVTTRALLALAPELQAVVYVEDNALSGRKLTVSCDRAGCHAPRRDHEHTPARALSAENLRDARSWLADVVRAPAAPPAPLLARWYIWAPLAALAIGSALVITFVSVPDPDRATRVTVDPSALH